MACGGIKAECEGRVHTPALTEQCPVAAESQVQRLLAALSVAQLGKIYSTPCEFFLSSKDLKFCFHLFQSVKALKPV